MVWHLLRLLGYLKDVKEAVDLLVADGRRYPQRDRRVVVILIQHGLLILLAGVVNADAVDLLRVLTSYGGTQTLYRRRGVFW